MNQKTAVSAINQAGALLVFPMDNRKAPGSLWSHFYPRTPMRWEWDESGDDRVARLWQLRGELSTTRQAVYTKWFRGRATYFSLALFPALLRALNPAGLGDRAGLGSSARKILALLEGESPLSTKELKRQADLKGRAHEADYERALKELWSRLLIVAFGEVDDGAFPSLAVGATRVLFEPQWREAAALSAAAADARVGELLPPDNLFFKHYAKLRALAPAPPRERRAKIAGVVRFTDF